MDIGLFKYPGGNGFLDKQIISIINDYAKKNNIHRYVEPFVGSGRAFYTLLTISPYINSFWINDIDPAIAAIWTSCIKYPQLLTIELPRPEGRGFSGRIN